MRFASNIAVNQTILDVEERLRQAMLESDVTVLAELLAPELIFTTFLGEAISKEQDLEAHASGFLKIHSIVLSEQHVMTHEETSVVTCLADIDATFNDDRAEQQFRFLRVWRKTPEGGLHVIAGQATLVYASLGL